MNLGQTYIDAFLYVAKLSAVASIVLVVLLRLWKRIDTSKLIAIGLGLFVAATFTANKLFHRQLFVDWHKSQNTMVPATGCLTYEPSFGHLFATYSMNRADFDSWVAEHPWPMATYDDSLQRFDEDRLGFAEPDVALATEMAPNGNQMRVYFKSDVMYLSYNVM
tara:strand:- start:104 stop:595 length:492 start_codon:yes stop_codon:yes gene_type:complete